MAIVMGLPSKGRMKEDALAVLTRAGLDPVADGDARGYRASLAAMPEVEIAFLTAGEIARELATGGLDLGITGEDLMREAAADLDERVVFEKRLGFGQADVVVAVPDIWLDVTDMADLDDVASHFRQTHQRRLRIATKYWRLTHDFFSAQHGIQVYSIVESLGATEGAPAAGLADIIVDITSTGATLKANRLKMLADGLILKSQACLIASTREMAAQEQAVREKLLWAIGCRKDH